MEQSMRGLMEPLPPSQASTSMQDDAACALVPFSFRNPFHDALRDEIRRFPIAKRQIMIRQGWKNDGKGGTTLGFGASVYDAAIALSLYLEAHCDLVRNKRVIELGCGPGLVGIVAAHLQADQVVVTDGDPASVHLTAANIELNELEKPQCIATEYLWGDETNGVLQDAPYDVVVGADIVACPYADAFDALLRAFLQLTDAHTELVLAYKLRHGSENSFFDEFERHFVVERVSSESLHHDFQDGDIVIFRARRRSQA
ncbi:hypothetical protein Poli38472_013823 [Pythium oligandrum]|uniref:Uncharacterized protein n=1 Tax=Pythium oligandrum TaxID=41045 RepID=A0A8K1C253_PYTOL|nr:hypothetical protein Poli38472_013823 [Pythium oligandrum]|eukprot:TMW55061.1 hypothetical protein Poli38472_013823 [Pythium oligandrum]